jgi:hypothetical protein
LVYLHPVVGTDKRYRNVSQQPKTTLRKYQEKPAQKFHCGASLMSRIIFVSIAPSATHHHHHHHH